MEITLPENLKTLGPVAFDYSKLANLTFKGCKLKKPKPIILNGLKVKKPAFHRTNDLCKIIIPNGTAACDDKAYAKMVEATKEHALNPQSLRSTSSKC